MRHRQLAAAVVLAVWAASVAVFFWHFETNTLPGFTADCFAVRR